jgi:hypothetical protein
MVMLYVSGKKVGTWAESEKLIAELSSAKQEIELRDENGKLLGRVVPVQEPICPWDPSITEAEIERRMNEPGAMTLAEFWKKMGVQWTFTFFGDLRPCRNSPIFGPTLPIRMQLQKHPTNWTYD